jgi:N-acetyl-gamma-glutamyl-phosphate reductase
LNMMTNQIKTVGIVGGAGYTGGELLRVLQWHPNVQIAWVHSRSHAGQPLHAVHQDLLGDTDLLFTDTIDLNTDILFLCLGHGESKKFLSAHPVPDACLVIDLTNDFRLDADAQLGDLSFVYGLPEWQRSRIAEAKRIANPGCFATAIQLGLLPLAKAGMLKSVHTTGVTGSTGAGQSWSATSHFSWRANNIQAYKTLTHQHLGEIEQTIARLQGNQEAHIAFVPWRGDFTRGIFVSSTLTTDLSIEALYALFEEYYASHPFTWISRAPIHLKQVVNTNKCLIQLEKSGSEWVIHSVIDNLLKGAVGQAIQNMNIAMGWEEVRGLQLKASYF